MVPTYEVLVVEAAGPDAGLLGPGCILEALALGAGLKAEEVGVMAPLRRGPVAVEVAVERARNIATPRVLAFDDGGGPAAFVLRREDDPPEEGWFEVLARWTDGGPAPSPGALGAALSLATGGLVGAECLGAAFAGPSWVRLSMPDRLLLGDKLPGTVEVAGRTVSLVAAAGGEAP